MHMTMNRLQCDIRLQGCQQGHLQRSTRRRRGPRRRTSSAVPTSRRWSPHCTTAFGFHLLSVDGTMKIAMGVRRRDAGTPLAPGGSQQDRVDHNTCVLTTRMLQGLGPCRGPQRQQTQCCRVSPGERGAPRRSGGCALGSRGQRVVGVARRPVVVVSTSSGRRAGHVPSPDEVRGLASRFSGSRMSVGQQVHHVLPFGGLSERGRA